MKFFYEFGCQKYRQLFNKEYKFFSQSFVDLKGEPENEIRATQSQALQIKYYATKILETETQSKGRIRQEFDDKIQHTLSTRTLLTTELYIRRQDRVSELKFNVRKKQG